MTGWSNGLSQDYNKQLGTWFADRLGARNQLRRDMETKNEALELANYLEICDANEGIEIHAADMLRSQAAGIERLEVRVGQLLCERSDYTQTVIAERDQLKVKLEQLTICDVKLPEPEGFMDQSIGGEPAYTKDQLIDHGNRRAAQAVTEFLERSGKYLTNDATREAAIKAAVLAERERCAQVANQQVMTSWNAKTDAHNTCALNIVSAIRKGEQA